MLDEIECHLCLWDMQRWMADSASEGVLGGVAWCQASHILKWLVKFLASNELAFGNSADVPSVMFYLQMSLCFCLLHQPPDLDWYVHRFDRYKIKSLHRRYFPEIRCF
jgi:hypothetical protein